MAPTIVEQKPRCAQCGNALCIIRSKTMVSQTEIDRTLHYECLWCEHTEVLNTHMPAPRQAA